MADEQLPISPDALLTLAERYHHQAERVLSVGVEGARILALVDADVVAGTTPDWVRQAVWEQLCADYATERAAEQNTPIRYR